MIDEYNLNTLVNILVNTDLNTLVNTLPCTMWHVCAPLSNALRKASSRLSLIFKRYSCCIQQIFIRNPRALQSNNDCSWSHVAAILWAWGQRDMNDMWAWGQRDVQMLFMNTLVNTLVNTVANAQVSTVVNTYDEDLSLWSGSKAAASSARA